MPVTEAVRGVDSARVAFTGTPTSPGDSDVGTMAYGGETVSSSTGGQGDWHPSWIGKGQPGGEFQPRVAAGAVWTFTTTGTDSFDVASFTLGLRYLAVVLDPTAASSLLADRRPGAREPSGILGARASGRPGPLAQLAEQRTFNPLVQGSSPWRPTPD